MIDRDEKTEETLEKISQTYHGKALVLPRREIENYFLVPEAVLELIKNVIPEDAEVLKDLNLESVKQAIDGCLDSIENTQLYPRGCKDKLTDVKGSELLNIVLREYHIEYRKVSHGLFLTQWISENNKEILNDIYNLFDEFLKN